MIVLAAAASLVTQVRAQRHHPHLPHRHVPLSHAENVFTRPADYAPLHHWAAVDTHDSISVNDNGGGFIPIFLGGPYPLERGLHAPQLSPLATAGSANRGDIPPGGSGSASSDASTQDQWSFTLSQTTSFTFDVRSSVDLIALHGRPHYLRGIPDWG